MTNNIENKFNIGDWIKWSKTSNKFITDSIYINITKNNLKKYNDPEVIEEHSFSRIYLEEEIRRAEEYLREIVSLRKGDYIRFSNGQDKVIDRILDIPPIKGPLFETDTYDKEKVATEMGYEPCYFEAVHSVTSLRVVNKLIEEQLKKMEKKINISKSQFEELKVRKIF